MHEILRMIVANQHSIIKRLDFLQTSYPPPAIQQNQTSSNVDEDQTPTKYSHRALLETPVPEKVIKWAKKTKNEWTWVGGMFSLPSAAKKELKEEFHLSGIEYSAAKAQV